MMQFLTYDNWYLTLLVFKFIILKGKVAMSTTSLKCRDGILPHIENHQYSGIVLFLEVFLKSRYTSLFCYVRGVIGDYLSILIFE